MQKLKYILIFLFIPLLRCNAQSDIEGFYSGKSYFPESNHDILVKFKNGLCMFSNHVPDTLIYKVTKNKIHLSGFLFGGDDVEVNFQMSEDSLRIYRPKVDTLLYSFCKIKEGNYIEKLVNDTNLDLNMPTQNGKKKRISEILCPKDFYFFLGKKKDSIIVSYKRSNFKLDSTLYLHFRNEFEYYDYQPEIYKRKPRLAFIDGDIKYSNILLLLWNLRMADHTKIWYILDSKSPDTINYIFKSNNARSEIEYQQLLKFSKPDDKPPIPPLPRQLLISDGMINNYPLIEVFQDSIRIDNLKFDSNSINYLKDKLKSLKRMGVLLHIDNNATYWDYINIKSMITKLIDDIRNEYSHKLFGKNYQELFSEESRVINKKCWLQTIEISKTEYEKIKNSLQSSRLPLGY